MNDVDESTMLSARVVIEACPPPRRQQDKALALLEHAFRCYSRFDAVSVPDIQDGAEFGRSRKRLSNLEFGAWVRERVELPLSLYTVSVANTRDQFEIWLEGARALDCHDVVVVGGDSSSKDYAGLGIEAAAQIADDQGFHTGGIIIPTRRKEFKPRPASMDELERLETKIREWPLSFFTTQILYDSEWTSCLLLDLVRRVGIEAFPKIMLTFSPFVCAADIDFAKKALGVYVPSDVERLLRGARSMSEEAIGIILVVWERISTFATEIGIPLEKLGVNIEYINTRNPRNVRAAFELAEEFGRLLGVR